MRRVRGIVTLLVVPAALSLLAACTAEDVDVEVGRLKSSTSAITICHHTSSSDHIYVTILVDPAALEAHLGHGDILGACGGALGPDAAPPLSPDAAPVTEACGDNVDNDGDGSVDEGCLGDHVWADTNRNGLQEDGEPGMSGIVFSLRSAATGALIQVAVSDIDGNYYFSGVAPDAYEIHVDVPAGYTVMPVNAGTDERLDSDFDPDGFSTAGFEFDGGHNYDMDCGLSVIMEG